MKMKAWKRFSSILCMAAVMVALLVPATVYAADVPTVIISMQESKAEPGTIWDVQPTATGFGYEIESVEWSTDASNWTPGKKVTLTVTVRPAEGNSFTNKTNVMVVNGDKASATRKGTGYVVRINYTPKVQLAKPEGIYYADDTTLCWDKVQYAGGYEVQIKRDGFIYKTIPVSGRNTTECDLSEYATDDYFYTCSVRAVAPTGKNLSVIASDWVDFDDEGVTVSGQSTTTGQFVGTGEYKRFTGADFQSVSGWQFINGVWYYFDPANYSYAMVNKQADIGGQLYSFDENGHMVIGWKLESDGYWYYYNTDSTGAQLPFGAAVTGWIRPVQSGPWYYLNDGSVAGIPLRAMLANTVTPDGYTVDASGAWVQ